MVEEQLSVINYLTEEEYEATKETGNINENELYITPETSE